MNKFYAPISGIATFGTYPYHADLETLDADVAIMGFPYDIGVAGLTGTKLGPRRIREASARFNPTIDGCYDFEEDEVFLSPTWKICDVGDIPMITGSLKGSFDNAEAFVRKVLDRDAMPVVMGGDHSITIPVVKALDRYEDLCVIQFDAHLDWSNAPGGQRYSHGSPMRRSSEMDHVTKMCQIGIRGVGSSRKSDFDDARRFGSVLISAKQAKQLGPEGILAQIPKAKHYYVTIDIDGFDARLAPGTGAPAPGGLDYYLVDETLKGIAALGNIVGFDLVEVAPQYDPSEFTMHLAAITMINFMGYILKNKETNG